MTDELILVVDDEEMVCSQAQMVLKKNHYRTLVAFNGSQALDIIRRNPPDLLLSDIRMPDIDGLQLFAAARKIQPDLTAVLMTGYGTIDITIKALHLGVSGFLQKPFTGSELTFAIEDALNKSKTFKEAVSLRLLSPLLEARHFLISELNLSSFCKSVTETTARESGADYCAVFLPDEITSTSNGTNSQIALHSEAVFMVDEDKAKVFSPRAFPAARVAARTMELGRTLSMRRSASDELKDENTIPGLVIAVPLITGKRTLGVLLAGRAQVEKPFTTAERELFEVLSGQLASIIDNLRLYKELSIRENQLHSFIGNFIEAQEQERKLFNKRLQNEVGVLLNNTRQNVQSYLEKVRPVNGREELMQAEKKLQIAISSLRRIQNDMRPTSLDEFGLGSALREYVRDFNATNVEANSINFRLEGNEIPRLNSAVETALFRACLEAINNAVLQSPGNPVEVLARVTSVRNKAVHVQIQINNEGSEINLEAPKTTDQISFISIQERLNQAGCSWNISNTPKGGTTVTIDYDIAE